MKLPLEFPLSKHKRICNVILTGQRKNVSNKLIAAEMQLRCLTNSAVRLNYFYCSKQDFISSWILDSVTFGLSHQERIGLGQRKKENKETVLDHNCQNVETGKIKYVWPTY